MKMGTGTRMVRAAVAASIATGVALCFHLIGGGTMPAASGIVVPLTLSFAVSVQLAGRTVSAWRTGLAVTASQLLFHCLFVVGAPVTLSGAEHSHHLPAGSLQVMADMPLAHGAHGSTAMPLAHLAAAALTTAALLRLDWALARAGQAWTAVLASLVPHVCPLPVRIGHHQAAPVIPTAAPRPAVLAGGLGLRGPPVR